MSWLKSCPKYCPSSSANCCGERARRRLISTCASESGISRGSDRSVVGRAIMITRAGMRPTPATAFVERACARPESPSADDQHQIRSLQRDPSPQHVRFGIFPICDAGGRKDQRTLVGIRQRESPADGNGGGSAGWIPNPPPRRRTICAGVAVAGQSADQHHGGRSRRGCGNHQRFDGLSARAEADDPVLGAAATRGSTGEPREVLASMRRLTVHAGASGPEVDCTSVRGVCRECPVFGIFSRAKSRASDILPIAAIACKSDCKNSLHSPHLQGFFD